VTLAISVPATTRTLLTPAQLRAAAGLAATDTSRDIDLAAIGLTVADIICGSGGCNLVGDGITPVTLRQETLIETFRYPVLRRPETPDGPAPLRLARRFLGTVAVVEDDETLVLDTDFEVNAGAGLLYRLSSDQRIIWSANLVVVTYQAGFATVPTPLADVAAEMVARRAGAKRDPMMRSERTEVPGAWAKEQQFWVDATVASDITLDMAEKLSQYRSWRVW